MSGADPVQVQGKPGSAGPLGHVHSISGSQVSVGLAAGRVGGLYGAGLTVGKFVKIKSGEASIVGVIAEVSALASTPGKEQGLQGLARVDLMGEIGGEIGGETGVEIKSDRGPARFHRGVTTYPTIGDPVEPLTDQEMRAIFDGSGAKSIKIGHL